ncbi:protein kinase [Streptomyces sp. cg36]|uniref:serine/threonine-protein kinase n=1 Tax=Streptomyces sp. cg36 TaxID=3238798 RepID=UPI0034E290FE
MSDLGRLIAGRYRLVERVGRGGMGTVWRAEDVTLGRYVALKKLHVPPHLPDDEVRRLHERTRREARSAARITHPNVIVVHDVLDDEGLPCIVMEYIPSVTLGDVLKERGTLPVGEAARIGLIMVAALRAAHAAGVLHRDVKPANVLLGHDGRIVLTDFGIAVESGDTSLTRTGELVGSVHYLAPERLRSADSEPGPACDLWSLGATLYQAVEGRPPYDRDTAIETAYAIAAEPHQPPRQAGPLTSVIEGLLAKDPQLRMDAHEAERLLARAASADTAPLPRPAGPEPVSEPAPAPAPRRRGVRRTLLWAVSAALVAALATGGALLWPEGSGTSAADRGGGASSSPAPPPVPAGYRLEAAGQGFAVPVPNGWKAAKVPSGELAFIDPTGLAGLRVDVVQFAGSDPLRHWRDTGESQTRRDSPGYERVRMAPTTFRGRPAGYWEFTFQGKVREFRAVEVAFTGTDGTQYVVYLSAPNAQWDRYRPVFDSALKGIRLPG